LNANDYAWREQVVDGDRVAGGEQMTDDDQMVDGVPS
jgi:hypothetical protein